MPSLLILVPLVGILVLNFLFKFVVRRAAFWFALALFATQVIITFLHAPFFYAGNADRFNPFFKVVFNIDGISFVALLCIEIVCLASLVVARYTLHDLSQRFNFTNLLLISSIGMNGLVLTSDIFSLYVFLEVAAVSSFIMIAFRRGKRSLEGAFKYIILSAVATVLMLAAIAILLLACSDTSFAAIRQGIGQSPESNIILFSVGMFISGLFIKAGLVPFHAWLPDAYSAAPDAVSVLLAGIVTKACGVYTLIRLVVSVFGFRPGLSQVILLLGAVSVLVGALAALGQNDFKRMLAYSSISQIGYIVLGLGSGTALGLAGAVFHFFNHAIFKSLLFVNAAAVAEEAHTTDMDKIGGLSSRMPVTGSTSVIGFLSAAGIPPLAGFWSKLVIIIALWKAGDIAYAVIAVLASILTLSYLLSMQRRVFFGRLKQGLEDTREVGPGFSFISVLLALIIIACGLLFPMVFNAIYAPIKQILIQ
ncbi:MAG: proton-conducting transporter membrane subunit [Candidatus Omnitrophota bacterium]